MRSARRGIAPAALIAGLLAAPSLAGEGTARELLRRSGLDAQLTMVEGAVRVAILERLRGEGDPERVERVTAAARRAFAPEQLRATVLQELARLDRRSARAALSFLGSGPGRRVTRAEVAAAEPDLLAAEEAGSRPETTLTPRRRALLERLERACAGGSTRLELDRRLSAAMRAGVLAARPGLAPIVAPGGELGLASGGGGVLEHYREAARDDDARVYRGLADEDLERYVDFAESPAGARYQAAVRASFLAALEQAARRFGELLAGERAA